MYNYRLLSFLALTTIFWGVEMLAASAVWFGLSFISSTRSPTAQIKPGLTSEELSHVDSPEDLSDTSRTFPTFSRQPPLRYSPAVKNEDDGTSPSPRPLDSVTPALEADDEGEDADYFVEETVRYGGRSDSGLGTSMESGPDPQSARRRGRLISGNRSRSSM